VIDLREEWLNAPDSMRVNSESLSNEIDESDVQYERIIPHDIGDWLLSHVKLPRGSDKVERYRRSSFARISVIEVI
jgi:hypothetical protein